MAITVDIAMPKTLSILLRFRNVEKIDIKTLKNVMKENFKRFTIYDMNNSMAFFTNDFRIGYFDNKILCLEEYLYNLVEIWYNYNIISLETGKRLSNDFYEDLVDYSEEFKEFFKKEFIEYHKISEYEFYNDYYLHLPDEPKQSDDDYYFPTPFIFNNDGTIDIYNRHTPRVIGHIRKTKIEMKKLKPYIKKDSIYRYLFD